ncbi:hypothetical protein SLEP1_g35065 [Rubroshorea leprosula]|uniref:Uncharacterized protein n=1 Tax=Rubroshorea leprosula TaxID=152421 RepID=A0AAV5KMD2_9ROSI|nr:hypothetical protein SLEP1_g35065 [Rubroshorea leprosula]
MKTKGREGCALSDVRLSENEDRLVGKRTGKGERETRSG